jgi:3-hydroxyacyl-CoA dehydrogenase / enoyl-CoA hydratase / 3-hydroxybutyryl-CoA epimerase
MQSIQLSIAQEIATLTLDAPGQPVNTMGAQFQQDLGEALTQLEASKDQYKGVVIVSAKSTWFAGGDLRALVAVAPSDAQTFFHNGLALKALLRRLEKLGRPVVAAINGATLGGGLELALSCHHRVCVDDAKIQIGFPEVTLGLLPGAGGVVKTVRLMGLQAALPLLMEGTRIAPKAAFANGWLNALVPDAQSLLAHAHQWIAANPNPAQPWDDSKHKIPGGNANHPAVQAMLPIAPAILLKKTRGNYPAPESILAAAVEGSIVDFDNAQKIESRYFTKLTIGPVAKSMISTFFFQMNEVKSGKSRPAIAEKFKVKKVGILGAGMMGAGIAWACASKGIACVLTDTSAEKAQAGKDYSSKLLAKRMEKGRITPEKAQAMLDLITPSADLASTADCDLIVEAVFENQQLKGQITHHIEHVVGPNTLIASNTSTLPITQLARVLHDQSRFVGLHFFSPVDKMPLVEIIVGHKTSDLAVARAYDFVAQIGKTPIVVGDGRGFYTSRVFGTFVNEGMALLGEGVPAATIENCGEKLGMPVGPLAVLDEVSLKLADDVLHQELDALAHPPKEAHDHERHDHGHGHGHGHDEHAGHDHHAHDDHGHDDHGHDHHDHDHDHAHDHKHEHKHSVKSKRMPESAVYVLEKMAHGFKRMGRAYGAGFYEYPEGEPKALWDGLSVFQRGAKDIPLDDIKDRLLYVQAIETVRCMDEGIVSSTRDANIGSIFAWGFPGYTGGTAQFVNYVGVTAFVARADELAARYGERFRAPQSLRDKAANNTPL